MREADKLKTALIRALADSPDAEDAKPQAILSRILDEIDAVVLPRDVHLDNGNGQVLTLTVKSRRLIRINASVSRALGPLPGVINTELVGQDDQNTALAHLLAAFAAHTTELSVSVTEPSDPKSLTEIGLAVDQLGAAIQDAGYALSSADDHTIEALAHIAKSHGLAWVLFEADTLAESGGATSLLHDCIEVALPHILKTERPVANRAVTWIFGSADTPQTAITVKGRKCIIAKLPVALTQEWVSASAGQMQV